MTSGARINRAAALHALTRHYDIHSAIAWLEALLAATDGWLNVADIRALIAQAANGEPPRAEVTECLVEDDDFYLVRVRRATIRSDSHRYWHADLEKVKPLFELYLRIDRASQELDAAALLRQLEPQLPSLVPLTEACRPQSSAHGVADADSPTSGLLAVATLTDAPGAP